MIRIFLGYDHREVVAYHVACHSIHVRSSQPVEIAPVMLSQLEGTFTRERNNLQSTDFSFSRFSAIPVIRADAIHDSDIICLDDIANLWAMRDDQYAVMCLQLVTGPRRTPFRRAANSIRKEKLV